VVYDPAMGVTNYLIDGVSGTGKTSVCRELQRRGYQAITGDTDLAYQGDPATGLPVEGHTHEHYIWDVEKVVALIDGRDADEWGGREVERRLILRLHRTREDLPHGVVIDATVPVAQVVDEILRLTAPGRHS